jgi:hypothetical protein
MRGLASFLFGFCGGVALMSCGFALVFAIDGLVKYALSKSELALHSDASFYGFAVGCFFLVIVAIFLREHAA